jgi:type I restriction enzyme R subunit
VFTTIHKFFPEEKGDTTSPRLGGAGRHPLLSERRNVVVIADEAHRSQYDFIDGFARHMRDALPHASFIGFTGTPIELADANTRAVFGDYISVYDIQRAVEDGATVPIYYECRTIDWTLRENVRAQLRVLVKRILRKYGYPPDKQEKATETVLEQAEVLSARWAA